MYICITRSDRILIIACFSEFNEATLFIDLIQSNSSMCSINQNQNVVNYIKLIVRLSLHSFAPGFLGIATKVFQYITNVIYIIYNFGKPDYSKIV